MAKATFAVKVYRYDPAANASPSYRSYELEFGKRQTVLALLIEIYRHFDADLAFRWSCGLGKCGVCAVRVNGRPVMACQEVVENQDLVIEPLKNFPVLKDLIVDRDTHTTALSHVRPFLERAQWETPSFRTARAEPAGVLPFLCTECLACASSCPAVAEAPASFPGPAHFTVLSRWHSHPWDEGNRPALARIGGIHNCTACKSCSEVCPKNLDVFRDCIQALREAVVAQGGGLPPVQAGFEQFLAKSGWLFSPRGRPFLDRVPDNPMGPGDDRAVGLFVGCRFNMQMQRPVEYLVELLSKAGFRVVIPRDQRCCGGPLLWTGQREAFARQRDHNLAVFRSCGVQTILTPCAGCGMVIINDYPEELSARVKDLTELLGPETGRLFRRPVELKVTYHDPCHLRRGQGIRDEPRALLASIPGLRFTEMREPDFCCGGMAASANRDLAERLARRKAQAILETGAQAVVTSCPTCQEIIDRALRRTGRGVEVLSLPEILLRAVQ
jgi:fumarate reductase (CoM/CoB) subunit B